MTSWSGRPAKCNWPCPMAPPAGSWSLLTNGGPVAIPGGDLFVLPALPVITDVAPLRGVPRHRSHPHRPPPPGRPASGLRRHGPGPRAVLRGQRHPGAGAGSRRGPAGPAGRHPGQHQHRHRGHPRRLHLPAFAHRHPRPGPGPHRQCRGQPETARFPGAAPGRPLQPGAAPGAGVPPDRSHRQSRLHPQPQAERRILPGHPAGDPDRDRAPAHRPRQRGHPGGQPAPDRRPRSSTSSSPSTGPSRTPPTPTARKAPAAPWWACSKRPAGWPST